MMSGPAPVLAATAAFGRTSSQPSLSTRTSMLYLALNFSTFFMYWSMSPCTKRLHRSTRSFAPFSGVLLHACAFASFTQISGPAAAPAARPAEVFRNLRRLNSLTASLLLRDDPTMLWRFACTSRGEARSARRVEQMRARNVRHEADVVAGPAVDAIAHERGHLLPVEAAEQLRVGARGLDHDDLGRQAVAAGDGAMLGTHAVEHRLTVGRTRGRRHRQAHAAVELDDRRAAVDAGDAGHEVHRRRADEASDERVDRRVVELEGVAALLDNAVTHHDDAVGHRHRLDLVMRDVDRRRLQALVQLLDLGAHLHAKLRVQIRQRLVEQEHLRVAHDRASHRDALALAAGELARVAVEVRRESEEIGRASWREREESVVQ